MPNPMTGEFDAVVQVGVRTVNRILAAQHGVQRPEQIYLHSFATRIEDVSSGPGDQVPAAERTGVRGIAQVQVSTPTISLPADPSASRVTARSQVRAHVMREEGSPEVPEYIHGELQATVNVAQLAARGGDVIEIDFRAADIDVRFAPSPGAPLSGEHIRRVVQILRNFLRTAFHPTNATVRLPADGSDFRVRSLRFKTMPGPLPDDARSAVALLLILRDTRPSDAARDAVREQLLGGGEHFAIGIAGEFLITALRRAVATAGPAEQTVDVGVDAPILGHIGATYRVALDPTSFAVQLQEREGRLLLTFDGRATTDARLPLINEPWPSVTFSVSQALHLGVTGGLVELFADRRPDVGVRVVPGGPVVGFLAGLIEAALNREIPGRVATLRDAILRQVQPAIRDLTDSNRVLGNVLRELRVPGARAAYASVQVRSAGLVVRGTLELPPSPPIDVRFAATAVPDGFEFNALHSWIPGGEIRRFTWIPNDDRAAPIADEHRFIAAARRTSTEPSQWCLRVEGTRLGGEAIATSRPACRIAAPAWVLAEEMSLAAFAEPLAIILRGPMPEPPDIIRAHFDPRLAGLAATGGSASMLVHFADPQQDTALAALREALKPGGQQGGALTVLVVLAPGQFAKTEPIVTGENFAVAFAEDYAGHWAKAFGATELPATLLVDPGGKTVWSKAGQLDASELVGVLRQRLVPDGRLFWDVLPLGVQPGERAADFLFNYAEDRQMALRRLRGRPVRLVFWTSWSEPCLAELRQLQTLQDRPDGDALTVLAVNDGEDPGRAAAVFKEQGLTLNLVTDPDRQIGGLYGVCCWPTTVSIDAEGFVGGVQQGLTPKAKLALPQ